MSDGGQNNMDTTLLSLCLDTTKQLISSKTPFKFNLQLPSGFTFNFTTIDQETTRSMKGELKMKSPSTLRRSAVRKQKFEESKEK